MSVAYAIRLTTALEIFVEWASKPHKPNCTVNQ
jgi:hypothetical protein